MPLDSIAPRRITRRSLIGLIAAATVAAPRNTRAQRGSRTPRVGVLVAESAPHPFTEAFRSGMCELGYVEGRNVTIEWRYADALFERAVELATALVQLPVDVIAAHHTPAVKAAMTVTKTIPIVMAPAGAPVQAGLVSSLARPGGNVTGLSSMEAELGSKRLELLLGILPGLSRVAILGARSDPFTKPFVQDFQDAAARSGLHLQPVLVDGPREFDDAFAEMRAKGAQAVVVQPLFQPHTRAIVDLAARHRLAIMSSYRDTTQAGGLISYSADHAAYFQRAAGFVDKILKGARPAELPVEQPTRFELVINVARAKALGLTIPASILARADEVVQ
jgi:putative ABC transport system substrate-binding protein